MRKSKTVDYLIRKIPEDTLWRQAKMMAASRGVSVRELLLNLLKKEVEKFEALEKLKKTPAKSS